MICRISLIYIRLIACYTCCKSLKIIFIYNQHIYCDEYPYQENVRKYYDAIFRSYRPALPHDTFTNSHKSTRHKLLLKKIPNLGGHRAQALKYRTAQNRKVLPNIFKIFKYLVFYGLVTLCNLRFLSLADRSKTWCGTWCHGSPSALKCCAFRDAFLLTTIAQGAYLSNFSLPDSTHQFAHSPLTALVDDLYFIHHVVKSWVSYAWKHTFICNCIQTVAYTVAKRFLTPKGFPERGTAPSCVLIFSRHCKLLTDHQWWTFIWLCLVGWIYHRLLNLWSLTAISSCKIGVGE